jgi:hypothetical protein
VNYLITTTTHTSTLTEDLSMKPQLTQTLNAFRDAFKTVPPLASASYQATKAAAAPAIAKSRNTTAELLARLAVKLHTDT